MLLVRLLVPRTLCPVGRTAATVRTIFFTRQCHNSSSSSSTYEGSGELKRKPLGRRPLSEYHEYVPPPPPTPPKRKDFYYEKPKFWKMHGTKFGRKRDLMVVLASIALATLSFAFYAVTPELHTKFLRRFSLFDSDSSDEREMQRQESLTFWLRLLPHNPGDEFTAADARELMNKQRFSVRQHSRLREPEEELRWHK